MRLLDTESTCLRVVEFLGDCPHQYAILSHTWEEDEVLFADVCKPDVQLTAGYRKIEYALQQAKNDGYRYLWVDTCCIDKSSSAELSEAINSMYHWYSQAEVCYAYLSDVDSPRDDLSPSRWFTRGWTLQELLAPSMVGFFTKNWEFVGGKQSLGTVISRITGISNEILQDRSRVGSASVAMRMSWAARRETTRIEDMAYCLLGIFAVSMPLLYGEREKAFIRLQEEILKDVEDQTIFAWRNPDANHWDTYGMLAKHPRVFAESSGYEPLMDLESLEPPGMANGRLRLQIRLVPMAGLRVAILTRMRVVKCNDASDMLGSHNVLALLCCSSSRYGECLGIVLQKMSESRNEYWRTNCSRLMSVSYQGELTSIVVPQSMPQYRNVSTMQRTTVTLGFRYLSNDLSDDIFLVDISLNIKEGHSREKKVQRILDELAAAGQKWFLKNQPPYFRGACYGNEVIGALHFEVCNANITIVFGYRTDACVDYYVIHTPKSVSMDVLRATWKYRTNNSRFIVERHPGMDLTRFEILCHILRLPDAHAEKFYTVDIEFAAVREP